jgi:hypothetical protein
MDLDKEGVLAPHSRLEVDVVTAAAEQRRYLPYA